MGIIRMKKSSIYCLVIVLVLVALTGCFCLCFGGCSYFKKYEYNRQIKNEQSQIVDLVLDCMIREDEEGLYNMFSEVNKDNCDIRKQISLLFDNVPTEEFNTDRMVKHSDGGGTSYDDGLISKYSFGYRYEHITDASGREYLITFGYMITDDKHKDRIGLECLKVLEINRNDPNDISAYALVNEYTIGNLELYAS